MPPRSEEDNQQIRDARRESIVHAALKVFGQKGFAATKISDIAACAGFSHGLVYHYFPSKEAVYSAVVDDVVGSVLEDTRVAEQCIGRRVRTLVERTLSRTLDRPDVSYFFARALLESRESAAFHPHAEQCKNEIFARTLHIFRQAQKAGEVVADVPADELAMMFVAMARGLTLPGPHGVRVPHPRVETILRLFCGPNADPASQGSTTEITSHKEAPAKPGRAPSTPRKTPKRTR